MTIKKVESSSLYLISLNENHTNAREAKKFFTLEKELLKLIFNLEREKACLILKDIHYILSKNTNGNTMRKIELYYYFLSSTITRKMIEEEVLCEEKAWTFNAICLEVVNCNLKEDNTLAIGEELIEFYCYIMKEKVKPTLLHKTVNEVIQYINTNVEKELIVDEIAKRFNVSTSHLSRIFREYTSVTLVEFIMIRKIEEVQYHLRFTKQKIAEIAEKFHFCNQSYFTRVFKKYTGFTPMRFRKDLDSKYFQFTLKQDDSL